jgi:hypothetical protein
MQQVFRIGITNHACRMTILSTRTRRCSERRTQERNNRPELANNRRPNPA